MDPKIIKAIAKHNGFKDSEINAIVPMLQQAPSSQLSATTKGTVPLPPMKPQQAQAPTKTAPVPITQVLGQQSDYDPNGVSPADEFATAPNTPVALPKGNWVVASTYDQAAPNTGYQGNYYDNQGWGNQVAVVNKDTGDALTFNHLNEVAVKPGDTVSGGVIGVTGFTGNATGPHVAVQYFSPDGQQASLFQSAYKDIIPHEDPQNLLGKNTPAPPVLNQPATPLSQPDQALPKAILPTIPQPQAANDFVEGTPDQYKQMISKAAKDNGVPTKLFSALLKQESNFDPAAQSPVGAIGIAQMMPDTAKGMGVDPTDPNQAIPGAAQYLSQRYKKYGDWDKTLASYNAGEGAVDQYGGIPPYPETQSYVENIKKMAGWQ